MQPDLHEKTALVTGAGRGIGKAIATKLAAAGATVVLAGRDSTRLQTVAREIGAQAGQAIVIPADVSLEADVLRLFDNIHQKLGQLDVLVNNAGMGIYGPVAEFSTDDFDQVLAVNLRGTFLCCREAMKLMIPARSGYIINVSSVVGFKGYVNQAAYTASKHGVMGLTKTLAVEAQPHQIRVSAILPGGVDTDMVASARPDLDRSILLQPQDIAQAVLFLLSLSENAAIDQIYIRRRTSAPF